MQSKPPVGYVVKRSTKVRGWWVAYRPGTQWIDWAPDRAGAIELAVQHEQGGIHGNP
jgi:hypothetical protein